MLGAVFGAVFGSCIARRTVRRMDLGFSRLNFVTGIILEAITQENIIAPAQFPKDSQSTAGQLIARGNFLFFLFGDVLRVVLRHYGAVRCSCGVLRCRTVRYGLERSWAVSCSLVSYRTVP
jgi:hypothetical protein